MDGSPLYTVAVRELYEFTAKHGDLDLRFTPSPSAEEGVAGHALVQGRRGAGYRKEVPLQGRHGELVVRGRADGVDAARRRVGEIKTFRGSLDRQRPTHRQLHWAQIKVYGWLVCSSEGWDAAELALVYLDLGSQEETVLVERCTAEDLRLHFEAHCERFMVWASAEVARRRQLDAALEAMRFPFGDFRHGQRPLAEAVFRAATRGRCLMAQAPTGIGKTMGTLFPMLKAMPTQHLDRVFFLTAKTSGRQAALDTLAQVPAPLRVLELVARDKSCEHPDRACHGDSCPLARGFYDRLPAARAQALQEQASAEVALTRDAVRQAALSQGVCPYYLSQELARWADVVVGDYNYYFDHGGLLHGLTQTSQWRVGLLVDEAHNLVERGRRMFSATLLPRDYHAELLGLPRDHLWVDVESPFQSAQLQVHTAAHISTRYRDRARSLAPIADLIAEQFHQVPGNYLAFQSSHEYLEQVADLLAQRHPGVPQWRQSRRMSERGQREFLERFTDDGRGVGFAVLGGAFSEGVDLPGRRLIGAFVATLGMPQVNPINEALRARMEALFGAGYDYVYFYPGLQKVVQAAGRVIRTTEDFGVLHLIDDRFARPEVRRLLPPWWSSSAPRWPRDRSIVHGDGDD
ncbi:helicase C-terminal domain-containing protein [Roseateles chitosanitabidus]|uniref:helicase C-terminal domain-containing protein n=1 Tax=Roseateles chitosanitabidus TaxID=65048 RepID=UPI0008345A38|nr:helicase C-terminal domain-containing protein [Roseateles chitosanitabidus]